MDPPSVSHAKAGATVIANCSASDETTGKAGYRETLIAGQSARLVCAYIYANAGEGESTQMQSLKYRCPTGIVHWCWIARSSLQTAVCAKYGILLFYADQSRG